jgi:hypothetical protein
MLASQTTTDVRTPDMMTERLTGTRTPISLHPEQIRALGDGIDNKHGV